MTGQKQGSMFRSHNCFTIQPEADCNPLLRVWVTLRDSITYIKEWTTHTTSVKKIHTVFRFTDVIVYMVMIFVIIAESYTKNFEVINRVY